MWCSYRSVKSTGTSTKLHPVVVISRDTYNASSPDVLIAAIMGYLLAGRHPGDDALADWKATGLLRASLA